VYDGGHAARLNRVLMNGTWSREIEVDTPLRSISDCRRHSNQQVVSVNYDQRKEISRFSEWDGVTYWTASRPFCKPDCAVAFARAAHKVGYRLKVPEEV
jgi:hypothetical protein